MQFFAAQPVTAPAGGAQRRPRTVARGSCAGGTVMVGATGGSSAAAGAAAGGAPDCEGRAQGSAQARQHRENCARLWECRRCTCAHPVRARPAGLHGAPLAAEMQTACAARGRTCGGGALSRLSSRLSRPCSSALSSCGAGALTPAGSLASAGAGAWGGGAEHAARGRWWRWGGCHISTARPAPRCCVWPRAAARRKRARGEAGKAWIGLDRHTQAQIGLSRPMCALLTTRRPKTAPSDITPVSGAVSLETAPIMTLWLSDLV